MDPSCLVSTVQAAGGGVMVWGIFSWHTLGPLVPIEHRLNATAYLSIVADHVHPFMTTVCPSSDATSSRIMHHVTKLKSSQTGMWDVTLWDVVEQDIHIMDVQPTNLQQLRDAIMSIWTKISEECFQRFVESMPQRIKAVLKAKGGPVRY